MMMRAFDQCVPNIIYTCGISKISKIKRLLLKDSKRCVKASSHANARV
jgi:hypothetical protein